MTKNVIKNCIVYLRLYPMKVLPEKAFYFQDFRVLRHTYNYIIEDHVYMDFEYFSVYIIIDVMS